MEFGILLLLFLFSFCFRSPNISATFAVVWGGSKPLDNPDDIHVLIYRCKEMADNCGKCLSLDEKFQCGWCQSSNKCEVKEKCGNDASSWLNRDQTCPNPQVTSFLPMLGPWEDKSRRYKLDKGDSTIYYGEVLYLLKLCLGLRMFRFFSQCEHHQMKLTYFVRRNLSLHVFR